ncbi:MAG: hypothetical protein ACOC7T_01985 [Planctomycetota bacterium]
MKIGWAGCDVTPERPAKLRGQFYTRIAEGTKDPLTATALAVEGDRPDGRPDGAVIVSCDRVSVPEELQQRVRDAAASALSDLDPRKVFLHATHTHDAPEASDGFYPPEGPEVMSPSEYADFFADRVAEAVAAAWRERRPGAVGRAFTHAVVGHNRRAVYRDGSARMYGETDSEDFSHVEGYEDHGVDLLFTWSDDGDPTGVVVNLACPAQVEEHLTEYSSDFWHETRLMLRDRYGPDLFVLAQCAPAGDQSPHFLLYGEQERDMRERRGLTERQETARRIARAVYDGCEPARRAAYEDGPVQHVVRRVELPARLVTDQEAARARAEIERVEAAEPADDKAASANWVHRVRNRRVVERYENQGAESAVPVELHALRLGDVALATNPFELFLDYGLRVKARSRAPQTMLVQLAAGAHGYLPTRRAVRGRSYGAEVARNQVGPEGGRVLVEQTLRAINGLWDEA